MDNICFVSARPSHIPHTPLPPTHLPPAHLTPAHLSHPQVCGVDRFTLDTKANGFEDHIKHDHHMWHYLAMMIHLREKEPTECNGWESYVMAKMQKGDTSFIPRNTAIALLESEAAEENKMRHLEEKLEQVLEAVQALQAQAHTPRDAGEGEGDGAQ